jgi:Protein of unknown function (DUF1329)
MKVMTRIAVAVLTLLVINSPCNAAIVQPGVVITRDNADSVANLLSPGNLDLVRQGMRIKVVPTEQIEWPPPYKSATEKYSPQVRLNERGELENYVAGMPFPFVDPNDPQAATKVMWNFSYGPQFADSVEIRKPEMSSYRDLGPPGNAMHWLFPAEAFHSMVDHLAWYNNVGRTEVPPIPTDPNAGKSGIRYRFAEGPIIDPSTSHGQWLIRYRYIDPRLPDYALYFALGRVSAGMLSDIIGPYTLDPDSYFGFAAKIEDYDYRLLGISSMLASVHAESSPARHCPFDDGRSVCPENWEIRTIYAIEAIPKGRSHGRDVVKRVLYIDAEGWFITASDQFDQRGSLWKTQVLFHGYRDRALPEAQQAVYPFKRIFTTAIVDEDLQSGFSSVFYLPGVEGDEHEGWFIDPGTIFERSVAAAAAAAINRQSRGAR